MSKRMVAAVSAALLLALPACEGDEGDDVTATRGPATVTLVSGG